MNVFYNKMKVAGYFDPQSENYLWVYEMEWLSSDEIEKRSDRVFDGALPFAINSAGDVWAFYNNKIYIFRHDEDEPELFAENLEVALFRSVITYLSDYDFDENCMDIGDECSVLYAKEYIYNCIKIFAKYWSEDMLSELERIGMLSVQEYNDNGYIHKSFISAEKGQEIINRFLDISELEDNKMISEHKEILSNIPIRDRTPFDDCFLEELSDHCYEVASKFYYRYNQLIEAARNKKDIYVNVYKKASDNKYFPRPSSILQYGFKPGMLTDGEIMDGIKYYIDKNTDTPIYSETYSKGKLSQTTFYKKDGSKLYGIVYMKSYFDNKMEFNSIQELCIEDNKITSVSLYFRDSILFYDRYFYDDTMLIKCEMFSMLNMNKPVSYITDKITDDGIFYGDKNPMLVSTHNYIYEEDVLTKIKIITCNLEQIAITTEKVKSTEYKKLKKEKII